ncbi:putative transcription factor bHLH family [Helianthus annuus]|uniref:Putative myc-type, basic helix-loop-helix (BHLH) domain-containing protein n=1 Tax=Helianthus annuus TaxID=4232 RepID=A0A251U9I5_HELAN|nr:transcription factor bHLH123 [Helianthus annuus]KAF5796474.1 putative transcription factor bHLH family [Helianthus annuus]KAJ0539790.1 putative transcription factor bHLH family [Helianthus annuus]KAJ0554525.1 putative transcription factor bHLH family [Helianthus annuus]KAJ0720101.1 putative transcription factor bHLH family [Helianthus annuus]KAJ0723327.1 putative transcription factor bHLH family [Helianthus annuus]
MADSWWDSRTRPCLDSISVTSMNLFQETTESTTTTTTSSGGNRGGGGGLLGNNPSLQMMELGLSSQPVSQPLDWNQTLLRGDQRNDDHQSGYQTLIQEDNGLSSNTSIFQETPWKSHKIYLEPPSEFKQINVRGFRLDEPLHYNDESGLNPSFQPIDHSYGSNSTIIQSLFGSDTNTNQQSDSCYDQNQGMGYNSYQSSYGGITMSGGSGSSGGEYPPLPPHPPQEFSGNSPPKVQPQLHFSNNAQFWNASPASTNDVRSSFFPLQMQSPSTIEDKPKNPISEMVKKSNTKSSSSAKRPRNENPPMPAFKVRKEKMGDRITALQQLVSPFGKTDTASVLSEAIEYIKFLHEQVNVLSTPYMKNAAIMQQQQQIPDKTSEGSRQDLRSRGLCLVPMSSTFPMTHETTVDFWTPSFGGTFR